MPIQTVKAKFLLGWMNRHDAIQALNSCIFDEPVTRKKAIALWKHYRERVMALEPRNQGPVVPLRPTQAEQQAIDNHLRNHPRRIHFSGVMKVNPGDLVAHQFQVVIDRCEGYAHQIENENARINCCLGIGMDFTGRLVFRRVNPRRICVDLPHFEFVPIPTATGFEFRERDRYISAVRISGDRLLLWAGYHRTHAILSHAAGDAAGAAPLLTIITGEPEVDRFFGGHSYVCDAVLGDRPALLRDFLDETLFIAVNLRKKRAQGRIEEYKPGKLRASIRLVDDDT